MESREKSTRENRDADKDVNTRENQLISRRGPVGDSLRICRSPPRRLGRVNITSAVNTKDIQKTDGPSRLDRLDRGCEVSFHFCRFAQARAGERPSESVRPTDRPSSPSSAYGRSESSPRGRWGMSARLISSYAGEETGRTETARETRARVLSIRARRATLSTLT